MPIRFEADQQAPRARHYHRALRAAAYLCPLGRAGSTIRTVQKVQKSGAWASFGAKDMPVLPGVVYLMFTR
jgi:hypothetical protein